MKGIIFKNIIKSYDKKKNVIDNFNLEIKDGEFVVMLGPSGCGKSTLLRILAGLEDIDSGEIYIDDKKINDVEAKDRNIAMVFQNYALYPHMTVYKNIAISLILKKTPKDIVEKSVKEVASVLDIEDLLDRKPRQLSGGQMQRVALARAMIRKPKVFLMDEPLSNLDSKLRVQTRAEIMKLYRSLKTTTIYVTHDQVEAMTMATTIVLMKDGLIQQKGTPEELYNKPSNIFVAGFIGAPQMNFINAKANKGNINIVNNTFKYEKAMNKDIIVGIRPEDISIVSGSDFQVELVENLGSEKLIYLSSEKFSEIKEVIVRCGVDNRISISDRCNLKINEKGLHVFDRETKERI